MLELRDFVVITMAIGITSFIFLPPILELLSSKYEKRCRLCSKPISEKELHAQDGMKICENCRKHLKI